MISIRKNIRLPILAVLVSAVFLFVACDIFEGPDLRSQAAGDVAWATARTFTATIDASDNGSTEPSGSMSVKESIPQEITTSAQQDQVLVGWKQTGGAGTATFTPVVTDGVTSTTKIQVVVKGGDVSIAPVYEARPYVMYATPIGNNIAKNASPKIVFNREIDSAALGTDQIIFLKLTDTSSSPIPFTVKTKAGANSIILKPSVPALEDYTTYSVAVAGGVKAKIDFTQAQYAGVTFINQEVSTRSLEQITPFLTGKDLDSLPPFNGSFVIRTATGHTRYTNTSAVFLDSFYAIDDSGDGGVSLVYLKNGNETAYPLAGFDYSPDLIIDWDLGATAEGQYTVGALFQDVNGNRMPVTSAINQTMYLDKTSPVISLSVSTPKAAGFVKSTSATLLLNASDPDLGGGSIPGSGESSDGTTLVNCKQMRFSLDNADWTTSVWEPSKATKTFSLASGPDGIRMVWVQVMDGADNVSTASAQVNLDTTPPVVSAKLLDGTLKTASKNINLMVTASDPAPSTSSSAASGLATIALNSASTGLAPGSAYGATLNGAGVASGTLTARTLPAIGFADNLGLVLDTGDGLKTISMDVADKVGNSRTLAVQVNLDTTPPTGGTVSITNGSTTNSTDVNLAISGVDVSTGASNPGTGITEMALYSSEVPPASLTGSELAQAVWKPYSSTAAFSLNPVSAIATQYVYVWFKDGVGNISASPIHASINYNSTKPTATITLVASSPTNSHAIQVDWAGQSYGTDTIAKVQLSSNPSAAAAQWQTLGASGSKTLSGTAYWDLTNTSYGGSTANGQRTISLKITDTAGNSTIRTATINYDDTAPVVTGFTVSGTGGTTCTNSSAVTVSFGVTDNLSLPANIQYQTANDSGFTIGGSGTYVTAASASVTILSYAIATGDGLKKVYLRVKDQAGNVCTTLVSSPINLDTQAPVISSVALNSSAGYTNYSFVTVSVGAADGSAVPSGLSMMSFSNNGSSWSSWSDYSATTGNFDITATAVGGNASEGTKSTWVRVKDAAGNVSAAMSANIVYDITAPAPGSLVINSGVAVTSTRTVTLALNPTDSLSPITEVGIWCSGYYSILPYTSTVVTGLPQINGSKTVWVQFKDAAGNYTTWMNSNITLTESWSGLNRNEIVGPIMSQSGEDTSFMATVAGNSMAFSAASGLLSFMSTAGYVGEMDYLLSGSSFRLYWTPFNDAGTNLVQGTGTSVSPQAVHSFTTGTGTIYYVDLDSPGSSAQTYNFAGADLELYFPSGNPGLVYAYPLDTAKFAVWF